MTAICPKCGTAPEKLTMRHLSAHDASSNDHAHTIAFCCGGCDAILGVQLDSATVGRPPTDGV